MTAALLVANGVFLAGVYAFVKLAGEHGVPPLGALAWSVAFAAVVVTGVAAWRDGPPRPTLASVRYAVLAGLLGVTAPNLVTFAALRHVPAGVIGVIAALSPVFTYAIALALRAERARPARATGIALGLAGVLAIASPRVALPGAAALPWALAAIAAPLLLAAGNVYRSLAWPAGLRPLSAASLVLLSQAALLVPLSALMGEFVAPGPDWGPADRGLAGAGVLTAAFHLGAFELQRRGGPVVVAQLGYVMTVASLLVGAVVFGERYPPTALAAAAVSLAGVALVNRGRAAAPAHPGPGATT